jgi:hypothetical protein
MGHTPCSDKCPDLSDRSSDTIELATYCGTAALTREETDAVSWPDFSETEEDTVYDLVGCEYVREHEKG